MSHFIHLFILFCFFCFRYIESMVHFASIRHPAAILDDLHGKVLSEAYQISKSTVTESVCTTLVSSNTFKLYLFKIE